MSVVVVLHNRQQHSLRMVTWLIKNIIVLVICCLLISTTPVEGYASWLKCFVELDHEEIVMHHPMTLPQDAPHQVFLEVQPYGKTTWIVAEEYTLPGHNNNDDDTVVSGSTGTTHTLKVRLRVPPALEMEEVQYVIEVKGDDVAFVDLGVMCDGVRAFSRSHEEHVVLRINVTSSNNDHDNGGDNIELLAGWASGYGPVVLTRTMRIKRNSLDPNGRDEL
jgi:hypothetical protein